MCQTTNLQTLNDTNTNYIVNLIHLIYRSSVLSVFCQA